jgi:hypothetical protein
MTYTFRKGRLVRKCSLCGSEIPAGEFFFRIDTIEYPYSSICKSCGHGNRVSAVKKTLVEKLKIRSARPAPSRIRDLFLNYDTRTLESSISIELEQEWLKFCKGEFENWKKTNPPSPLFINNPHWMYDWEMERKEKWKEHIDKIGDEWWKARGYRTIWPDDDRKPLQVVKE